MTTKTQPSAPLEAPQSSAQAVDLRSVDALIPYARNSNVHSPEQVAGLASAIDAFGLKGAIVVRDGIIAAGHGTLAACRLLMDAGKAIYPVPGREGGAAPFPAGMLPVQDATGWTDASFRAFVIADNAQAKRSAWDRDMLALEVADLGALDVDLDLLGFDADELAGLIGGNGAEDDAPPESSAKEIDTERFEMNHKCPRCGFEFDAKA